MSGIKIPYMLPWASITGDPSFIFTTYPPQSTIKFSLNIVHIVHYVLPHPFIYKLLRTILCSFTHILVLAPMHSSVHQQHLQGAPSNYTSFSCDVNKLQ
jgi:hypothetical protein